MSKNKAQAQTLGRILKLVRKQWPAMLISIFMSLIYVAASLYIPILVGRAIDCMLGPDRVDFSGVWRNLTYVLTYVLIGAVTQWIMSQLNNRVTYRVSKSMRDRVFTHLQKLPLSYLDSHAHGDIVSRVVADVDTFADGLLMGFTQLFTGVVTILGTLILMFSISWEIALVVVCITPLSLIVANFIAKSTYNMFRNQTEARGKQTAFIDETVGNIKVVQAFGHEDRSMGTFDQLNSQLEKCSLKAIFFSSLTNPCTRFVNSIVYAGVALVGAFVALTNPAFTVGYLSSFLNYANQYTKPFNEISGVVTELQNSIACASRVFELLDVPQRIPDPAQPQVPQEVRGALEIQDLFFSYVPEKPLIRNFDLQVQPGQKIAIVGPTGCGKTTFINVLMRFYDPTGGKILLDGVDTRTMRREDLRRSVGMVLQDTWLKAGTIRQNIAAAKPDASLDEIVWAAKQAHAHSFIKRLPQGYDTVISEDGGGLSQGQKQLLCIARVMLCLPPMLFLDEATSSIDTRTELKIQKAFDAMMQGRTSFIVAHRLSTIQGADRILVMRDGQIVEQGNHRELLKKKGFYAQLYESQFAH